MDVYQRLCLTADDPYYGKTYKFTDGDDYTHAVIMNTAMPELKIPRQNVIGLAFEPPEFLNITTQFIEYALRHIGKYYIGSVGQLPPPFTSHFGFMWHCNIPKIIPEKTKTMSIIFSKKGFATGHKYRMELIKAILNTDLPIDIYGTGCELLKHIEDSRIKGPFDEKEPYLDYKYHIAIENYRHDAYISEKFMNPILCKCIPIYWGAQYVETYFPTTCFKLLGRVDSDMILIRAICDGKMDAIKKNPEYPENMKFTEYIKRW
jgi:hypothetical protein